MEHESELDDELSLSVISQIKTEEDQTLRLSHPFDLSKKSVADTSTRNGLPELSLAGILARIDQSVDRTLDQPSLMTKYSTKIKTEMQRQ